MESETCRRPAGRWTLWWKKPRSLERVKTIFPPPFPFNYFIPLFTYLSRASPLSSKNTKYPSWAAAIFPSSLLASPWIWTRPRCSGCVSEPRISIGPLEEEKKKKRPCNFLEDYSDGFPQYQSLRMWGSKTAPPPPPPNCRGRKRKRSKRFQSRRWTVLSSVLEGFL